MSYLVLYKENSLSRLRVHQEETVPEDTICWYLDNPTRVNRVVAKIKKFWLSGSMYEKGALLVIDQLEAAEHIRTVLGPSLEEQVMAKEAKSSGRVAWWWWVFFGIFCAVVVALWIVAQSLIVIALIPVMMLIIGVILK